ncbi:MAG: gluconate kinase [Chloroflexota bacterium]|nr:MAG: gluconate kinase [Chloroflexota bacterium]
MTFAAFLGIDLGTTGVRALVVDLDGRTLGEAAQEYPLHTPRSGWAEQDPREVSDGAIACARRALRKVGLRRRDRVAIGFSGTFHNVAPFGLDDEPRGRALIWADTRATHEAAWIKEHADASSLYRRTGCPVHPMYLPAKLRWLRANGLAAPRYRSIKEYVAFRFTGEWVCDLSVASGTGLLAMERRAWDDGALGLAEIDAAVLSPIVDTSAAIGTLTAAAATALGVSADSVVVAGAGDGVLSSLGAGTIGLGQATVTIGTSGAVRLVTDAPRTDREGRTWCYYLAEGKWVVGAAINNGGIALRWALEKLCRFPSHAYDGFIEGASEAPIGATALFFLPFLTGERAPYWNAEARGVLFGLSIDHDHRHIARAVMEGIGYRMRSIALAVDSVAGPIAEARATGGYTRSPFWMQLAANVLNLPLRVPSIQEASALGAAELAMIGVGALPDLAATERFVTASKPVAPEPAVAARYAELFDEYMRLYWSATPHFSSLTAIRESTG